jgi:type II secretion system protein H
MRKDGRSGNPRPLSPIPCPSHGFTLIELVVVIAILAVMLALIVPRLGEIGEANLKRSARHLTGMIRFLHEEAQARKTVLRLVFDIHGGQYWIEALVPVTDKAVEFQRYQSVIAGEGSLAGQTTFRDIAVNTHPDAPYILFTPDGWIEPAIIHLRDGGERDYSLLIQPLTGNTELREGYVEEK